MFQHLRELWDYRGLLYHYMATGLPTVAFDTPVAREYLAGDGVYATPGDLDDLARQLGASLFPADGAAAASYAALGRRLRQRSIQRFGWEAAGHVIEDVYGRLLGARSNPGRSPWR